MLWSLRNKLVLTYLLIGLAPVVLFVTLVSVMAYIAAGQFAIHLADIPIASRTQPDERRERTPRRTASAMLSNICPGARRPALL